jgi:hypothetical protein
MTRRLTGLIRDSVRLTACTLCMFGVAQAAAGNIDPENA